MSITKEWLGAQGVRTTGRRWYLDSYDRTTPTGPRWGIGWMTCGERTRVSSGGPFVNGRNFGRRMGVEVCGPRRCTALYFMPDRTVPWTWPSDGGTA